MPDREQRINEALKLLGEEYRLGMLEETEYRARRRRLVDSWSEQDVTTSPGARSAVTSTQPTEPGTVAANAPGGGRRRLILFVLAFIILVAVATGLGWRAQNVDTPATPNGSGEYGGQRQ